MKESTNSDGPVENSSRNQPFQALLKDRKAALQAMLGSILSDSPEVVCELGCGHGHFLVAYAQSHPDQICLGVDIDSNRIERANRKQVRAKSAGLHFIRADAGLFLEALPSTTTLRDVFILFPDPWPKKRHHKHRLIQPAFLHRVYLHATPHTRIYFRTDHEGYFGAAHEVFAHHLDWQIVDESWPFENESVFQSRAASFRSLVARTRSRSP